MTANHSEPYLKVKLQFFAEETAEPDGGGIEETHDIDDGGLDAYEAFGLERPQEQQEQTQETDQQTEEEPATTQEEPKGIKVKYLKEEQFIPEDQIQDYVQKGLNHDRLQQQLEQTKQQAAYLDRLAQMSGYTNTQEFLQAVEVAEQQRNAQQMGIPEDAYRQYFQPVNQKLTQYEQEIQQFRNQELTRQIESQVNELEAKYPDFGQYANQVFDMAIQKGVPLDVAYKAVTYEDRINNTAKKAEQKVIKQQQLGLRSKVESLPESSNETVMSEAQKAAFAAFGIDPKVGKQFIRK